MCRERQGKGGYSYNSGHDKGAEQHVGVLHGVRPLRAAERRRSFFSFIVPLPVGHGCEHAHTSRVRVATTTSLVYIDRAMQEPNVTRAWQTRPAQGHGCLALADRSCGMRT